MRRIAIAAALAGAGVLAVRGLVPKLHARLLAACERMFEQMPEEFPPKRIMRDLEEVKANSAHALELLEQRGQANQPEPPVTATSDKRTRRSPQPARASETGRR